MRTRWIGEPRFKIIDLNARHIRKIASRKSQRAGHVVVTMKNSPDERGDQAKRKDGEPQDADPF